MVATLFGVNLKSLGFDVEPLPIFLPPIYASVNALTAIVVLVVAVIMIKKGNRRMHEKLMKFAILLSVSIFSDVCGLSHDK